MNSEIPLLSSPPFARFVRDRALAVLEASFGVLQLQGGMFDRRVWELCEVAAARRSPISPNRTLGRRCRLGGGPALSVVGCAVVVGSGAVSVAADGAVVIGGSGGCRCVSDSAAIMVTVSTGSERRLREMGNIPMR